MASTEVLGLQWLEHANIFNQAIISLRNKVSDTKLILAEVMFHLSAVPKLL